MFCRQLKTHQKKKKKSEFAIQYCRFASPVLKFPITHEVCRGFNPYLELKTFFSSSLNIYHSTTVINNVNKQNKKEKNAFGQFEIHGRLPAELKSTHDPSQYPAYIYTLDKNNSKHIQLKRKNVNH